MKKIAFILLTSCLFSFIISCKSDQQHEYQYSCINDTLQIEQDDSLRYLDFATIKEFEDSIFICFKPITNDCIYTYLYEPQNIKLLRKDTLPGTFARERYGKISSAVFINKDSIILFQENKISIYNFVTKQLDFEYHHSDLNDTSVIILLDRSQPIIWNENNKSLLLYIIRWDDKAVRRFPMDTECVGELNLTTKKLSVLPIKYSEDYAGDRMNLPYRDPFFTFNDPFVVTGYGISPVVNIYNCNSGESTFLTLKHEYYSEIRGIPRDSAQFKDALVNTLIRNFRYLRIIYDPLNQVYYRFYELAMQGERGADGLLKTYMDKQLGVNIIDADFKIIDDLILDSLHARPNWYPTSEGLLQLESGNEKYFIRKLVLGHK